MLSVVDRERAKMINDFKIIIDTSSIGKQKSEKTVKNIFDPDALY